MKSAAATVDDFLAEQPEPVRRDLAQLRAIIRAEVPQAVEGMNYGMPVYKLPGQPLLCGFNAQKQYLAFYVGRVPDALRDRMAGFSLGKGCVRFKRLDVEKAAVLRDLLREVVAQNITC
jgi:uncharacterized protein YdhG (YjbR/CyaY superfamily)